MSELIYPDHRFCGMTVSMMQDNAGTQEGEWYAEQRDELIAVLISFAKRARLM